MCIYIADHLDLVKSTLTRFRTEVTIALLVKDKPYISCFYRSPSNTDNDNLESITDLRTSLQPCPSHHLIVGAFNLPNIDWDTSQSRQPFEQARLDIFNDHFLTQHVHHPTRYRLNQTANILDLVLTNEENMIPNLE